MEISSLLDIYISPATQTPQQEIKPMKAPDCDQDVQRFESILKGEGPYQPKTLDLVIPAIEPNAIQNVGHTILDKVSTLKSSVDNRMDRVNTKLDKMADGDFDVADALNLQMEIGMFSIEATMMSKSGEKAGEGLKTLFRNQ
jgi:hypothetical protein